MGKKRKAIFSCKICKRLFDNETNLRRHEDAAKCKVIKHQNIYWVLQVMQLNSSPVVFVEEVGAAQLLYRQAPKEREQVLKNFILTASTTLNSINLRSPLIMLPQLTISSTVPFVKWHTGSTTWPHITNVHIQSRPCRRMLWLIVMKKRGFWDVRVTFKI